IIHSIDGIPVIIPRNSQPVTKNMEVKSIVLCTWRAGIDPTVNILIEPQTRIQLTFSLSPCERHSFAITSDIVKIKWKRHSPCMYCGIPWITVSGPRAEYVVRTPYPRYDINWCSKHETTPGIGLVTETQVDRREAGTVIEI